MACTINMWRSYMMTSVISKWSFKLIDDPRVIIYHPNRLIIQATGLSCSRSNFCKKISSKFVNTKSGFISSKKKKSCGSNLIDLNWKPEDPEENGAGKGWHDIQHNDTQHNDTQHNSFKCHYTECHYAEYRVLYIDVLSVIMLSVVMPNVVMLSVVMLSVIMLSVMAPGKVD